MTEIELNNLYFEWMYQLVCDGNQPLGLSYKKLLGYLHEIDFNYTIDMDGNRAEDGIDLRYHFGFENAYEEPMVSTYLDNKPCSVLEMLIALSMRCENIMGPDEDYGLSKWFWKMIKSLKLYSMTDSNFDPDYTYYRIDIFMGRKYKKNGEGGLFTIKGSPKDLRTVEIWYQMCLYLDTFLEK